MATKRSASQIASAVLVLGLCVTTVACSRATGPQVRVSEPDANGLRYLEINHHAPGEMKEMPIGRSGLIQRRDMGQGEKRKQGLLRLSDEQRIGDNAGGLMRTEASEETRNKRLEKARVQEARDKLLGTKTR